MANDERLTGTPIPDWQPCAPPPSTTMDGTYCRVEPLDPDTHSTELYHAFIQDESNDNWIYLPYGPFSSERQFRHWVDNTCTAADPLFHAIIDNKTQSAVGVASYLRIDAPVGVIETGHIHYSPLMQQTPVATEAMYLMMRRVFDELGYRRYEWKCDSLNERSRNAALRLGFKYEGTFRQATMYKGRNRDTAWFSVIDKEWPSLKTAFEQWLEPGNFDGGQQKISLARLRES
jgi:RimJ/RimL family protein N-acetyltransferase